MSYLSCTTGFVFSNNATLKCFGSLDYAESLGDITGDIAACSIDFTINNSKIYCDGVNSIYSTIDSIPDGAYIFQADFAFINAWNTLEVTDFISEIANSSEQTTTTTEDYELSTDLMDVMFAESMYIFGFGLLLGGIISMIRKLGHK